MAFDLSAWKSSLHARAGPKVGLTLPPLSFLKFPPSNLPQILPPPSDHPTLAHPFTIPVGLYNAALSPNVPILAALGYVTTIHILNGVNESRGFKPWAFSKTRFFKLLIITHNIILAVYSAWTFVGMLNALRTSIYPPWEEYGLAGTVDSLCKMNGPRGPGSAAVYEESTSTWSIANRFFHLGADGLAPESTDVGRIWNQGLAFYGWLFYLSKFYEVIDTLIIIAKGKKSSFLQTYHHAGAMLCMWAGIRYMSAPIWMFVFVNSFIHTIMYTFYLCSAIGVRVPVWFKRTLTTLQITQFVVGASYAFIHLFIKYQTPVSIPYTYHLGNIASAVASDASTAASSIVSTVTAVATDDWQALLKKAALRAAGREGLAENVYNRKGQPFGIDATKAAQNWIAREETRYRDELQWTHCLSTSGQTFAILLNVVYLLPLTWLFGNFFIRSYLQRIERRRSSTASQKAQLARESARDAAKRSGRRLSQAFEDPQTGVEDTGDEIAIVDTEELKDNAKKLASRVNKQTAKAGSAAKSKLSNGVSAVQEESSKLTSEAGRKAEGAAAGIKKKAGNVASKIEEDGKPIVEEAKQGMASTLDGLKQQADLVKTKAEDLYQAAPEKIREGYEQAKSAVSSMVSGGPSDGSAKGDSYQSGAENVNGSSTKGDQAKEVSGDEDGQSDNASKADGKSTSSDRSGRAAGEGGSTARAGSKETEKDEAKELSPKEQVQSQDQSAEGKAEANTGDAKEDDSPAKQPSTKNTGRKGPSAKEKRSKQNTDIESTKRKDVAGKDASSKGQNGQGNIERLSQAAQEKASDLGETAKNAKNAFENSSPAETLQGVASKAKDNVEQATSAAANKAKELGAGQAETRESGDVQDYEDQKESWIHVPQGSNDKQQQSKSDRHKSGDKSSEPADTTGDVKTPDAGSDSKSPEWFENLTTGIDSPTKSSDRKDDRQAGGEGASASGDVDQTENDTTSITKQEQDKILDESEVVRDEPVEQGSAAEKQSSEGSAAQDKIDGDAKKEEDKIIDESEPVRDEIKDTGNSTTGTKDNTTKDAEAGA